MQADIRRRSVLAWSDKPYAAPEVAPVPQSSQGNVIQGLCLVS